MYKRMNYFDSNVKISMPTLRITMHNVCILTRLTYGIIVQTKWQTNILLLAHMLVG